MSPAPDFTRWNRAGLSRFRYVDGNALTFIEALRGVLGDCFPEWTELASRGYDTPSQDWAWEIGRAFARACHVLGEHVDAYANEGYLRTATQWDSVRKLVAMLDVQPAPPASASTPLVIEAKGEPGTLVAGFAVRHTPQDGGAPVVFETLEDLDVDPAMNALHLAEWNRSPAPLVNVPPPRPVSPMGRRSARAIQGVGPEYGARLDARAPLGSGGTFRIADFRTFQPTDIFLWEAKSKADVVLDFAWSMQEVAPIAGRRLGELVFRSPADLARLTGRPGAAMARLLEDIRTIEMTLDEDVFRRTPLADLLSPGPPPPDPPPLWIAPPESEISAGQLALVVRDEGRLQTGAVTRVRRVDRFTNEITLDQVAHQPAFESWTRGVSSLLARPRLIAVAHLAGSPGAVTSAAAHGLSDGDVVAWHAAGGWVFADVQRADETSLLLSGDDLPNTGADVFRAVKNDGASLPLGYRAAATRVSGQLSRVTDAERREEKDNNQVVRYYTVTRANTNRVVFVPGAAQAAGQVSAVAPAAGEGKFGFAGKPVDLESGQWVVGEDRNRLLALRIATIEEHDDHFELTFESVVEPAPRIASLPVISIMGVGPNINAVLWQSRVQTIGDLARLAPADIVPGLTVTSWFELRAKARVLTSFPFEASDLEPILERPLLTVLGTPLETLADELGKPVEWTKNLIENVRLVQAVLDEPPLSGVLVRDLLPIGPPRPVRDYVLRRLDRVYGNFAHVIRPSGWDVNDTPVAGGRLFLELVPPALLKRGRTLVIERDDFAREVSVAAVDPSARTIDLVPPIGESDGFTLHNLIVRGNVQRAGHGEGKPSKVLGSGDAAARSQRFVLNEKNISFVADATQPAGVAAAVKVTVADQTWLQVGTLRDSRPTDPHYEVRLTEDGTLAFTFGDGLRGRRLPTGTNNVRVGFRTGTGLAGNLPPGSLSKPVRPSAIVDAVLQPLDATGGNDRENVASLKEQAPRSVLTLERAVSLADFGALAAHQASVWQARAFALPTGGRRHASVEVVVVPAGGGPLGSLAADLTTFLTTNAAPGIDVRVSPYQARPFDIEVEIEVKSAEFDPDDVRQNVETALFASFGLRVRHLGASLFVSELYEVVENVIGVESSRISVGFGQVLSERVLRASDREAIFLDPQRSRFSVSVREFLL